MQSMQHNFNSKNIRKSKANAACDSRYTVLFIPDGNSSPSRFSFHRSALIIFVCAICCAFGGITAVVIDYIKIQRIVHDYQRLRTENNSIKSEAAAIISRLEEVQSALHRVDSFSNQIREMAKPENSVGKKQQKKNPVYREQSSKVADSYLAIGPLTREDYIIAKELRAKNLRIAPQINFDKLVFRNTFEKLLELAKQSDIKANQLEKLLQEVKAYQTKISITPTLAPARGYISSVFGQRESPFSGNETMHWGIDIAGYVGSRVVAAAAGTVVSVRTVEDYGKVIDVDHGNGVKTRYAHLSKFLVKPGDKIIKGDFIAEMGDTGRSTGPHLHYEVELNGKKVDPAKYIHDLKDVNQ